MRRKRLAKFQPSCSVSLHATPGGRERKDRVERGILVQTFKNLSKDLNLTMAAIKIRTAIAAVPPRKFTQ